MFKKKKKSETLEKLPTECITFPYKTDTDVLKLNKVSPVSVLSFSIYLVMQCFVFYLKDRFPGQQMCSQTKTLQHLCFHTFKNVFIILPGLAH